LPANLGSNSFSEVFLANPGHISIKLPVLAHKNTFYFAGAKLNAAAAGT